MSEHEKKLRDAVLTAGDELRGGGARTSFEPINRALDNLIRYVRAEARAEVLVRMSGRTIIGSNDTLASALGDVLHEAEDIAEDADEWAQTIMRADAALTAWREARAVVDS